MDYIRLKGRMSDKVQELQNTTDATGTPLLPENTTYLALTSNALAPIYVIL